MPSSRPTRMRLLPALAALLLLLPATAQRARADVSVALTPAHAQAEPDSSITIDLTVTASDASFNGFTAVIAFDPAALTFVPRTLAQQEGCLMNGTCSGACGATFARFDAAGDSLVIRESLLCDSTFLTGPGQLYRLRFTAPHLPETTFVRVRRIQFFNGGVRVTPVTSADAEVDVYRTLAVGPAPRIAGGLTLAARPNPARGPIALAITSPQPGEQSVDVLDLAGRLVRRLDRAWYAAGERSLRWDGTGGSGERLPAGVYLVRVGAAGRIAQSRVVLLH